jgi:hypothetical protein
LERSGGALSDGTISFSFKFSGDMHFLNLSQTKSYKETIEVSADYRSQIE